MAGVRLELARVGAITQLPLFETCTQCIQYLPIEPPHNTSQVIFLLVLASICSPRRFTKHFPFSKGRPQIRITRLLIWLLMHGTTFAFHFGRPSGSRFNRVFCYSRRVCVNRIRCQTRRGSTWNSRKTLFAHTSRHTERMWRRQPENHSNVFTIPILLFFLFAILIYHQIHIQNCIYEHQQEFHDQQLFLWIFDTL